MGVSDNEANYYENEYSNGHTIVAVRADNNAENAWSLMQANGAYNYSSRMGGSGITNTGTTTTDATRTGPNDYPSTDATRTGMPASQRSANNINNDADTSDTVMPLNTTGYDATQTGSNATTNQSADYTNTGTDEAQRLRLREEQLNVNKQPVQTGEVQLHKDVVEEQKTVNVPVTHEEVYVERRPATGNVDDNTPIGEGEDIRVPVSEEKVNVDKNTVVTGEVAVGKRAVQENQQVSDTVRREEARLDQDGDLRVNQGLNNDNVVDNTNTNTTNP
ncbi:MAG TPA: hypothetical protein DHW02_06580 [Ktedonobacter sp.]|nr:hypothetical protein [Ktedonobacter sp.]